MLTKVKDTFLDGVQNGLPMVMTTLGAVYGASKTSSVWKTGGYAALGWLTGYLAQMAMFSIFQPSVEMPEESGTLAPQYTGKQSSGAPTMPSIPEIPGGSEGGMGRVVNLNPQPPRNPYGSSGFDPGSTGS